jgi:hypothetical protein
MQPAHPPASYGSTGAAPPVLPIASSDASIVFEWAAIFPLAIYLADRRLSHKLVGQASLAGFLPTGLFPRLGVLNMVCDFLKEGPDFLDRASSVSELRRTVWDVNTGNIFTCANGAASDILAKYVLRKACLVDLSDNSSKQNSGATGQRTTGLPSTGYRRCQTLHILDCQFMPSSTQSGHRHRASNVQKAVKYKPILYEVVLLLVLLGLAVISILFGVFATTAAIVLTVAFRILRYFIRVTRPSTYLENNEPGASGCMLVALHENATTWYLYRGSRAIIDTLLNKSMIEDIAASPLVSVARVLATLQLATMTYAAAQKGWDGVGLLAVIIVAWVSDWVLYREHVLAAQWLKHEDVDIRAQSFKFSGRVPMLGAIQVLKGTGNISWMDGILAPSNRRNQWLADLVKLPAVAGWQQGTSGIASADHNTADAQWAQRNTDLVCAAMKVIQEYLKSSSKTATRSV